MRLKALVFSLLSCVLARPALAQDPPPPTPAPAPTPADPAARDAARKLFEESNVLYAQGNYEGAREKLEQATKMDPTLPGPWRNLGLTYRALKMCRESIDAYLEYLRLQPDGKWSERVRREIEVCRKELGEAAGTVLEGDVGGIAVRVTNTEGATVSIDGIKRGTQGEVFKIPPGMHVVMVERPGYLPKTENVEVLKGVTRDIVVTLEEDPDAPIELRLGPGAKGGGEVPDKAWIRIVGSTGEPVEVAVNGVVIAPAADGYIEVDPGIHTIEARSPGRDTWRRRVVLIKGQKRELAATLKATAVRSRGKKMGWIFLGSAAAALAVGAAFGIIENGHSEDARDIIYGERLRPNTAAMADDVQTRADYDDAVSKADTAGLISNIGYGVAAASLGVSIYFFVKSRSDERPGLLPGFALSPSVTPRGAIGVAASHTVRF